MRLIIDGVLQGASSVETGGRFSSVDQYLVAATLSLPSSIAAQMRAALAADQYLIRAGSYARDGAMCPLAAADAHAADTPWEALADDEQLGGALLRFAVSFDLCAAELGDEAAIALVRGALMKWT
jgi:hypothetical protein